MKINRFMQNQQRACYHEFLSRLDGIVHWYQEQELLVYLPLPGITKWQVQFIQCTASRRSLLLDLRGNGSFKGPLHSCPRGFG